MTKRIRGEFTGSNAGRPYLELRRNPKWSHVHWSDGSLFDYHVFARLIEVSTMNEDLKRIFDENRSALSSKSELMTGGCIGCFVHAPTPLALRVFELVKGHFDKALKTMRGETNNGSSN